MEDRGQLHTFSMASILAKLKTARYRDLAILAAAVLLLTVPFIGKAFDWDDREFIEFAQVVAKDPTQLHLEDLSYKGNYYEEFRTSHPPLLFYYLSLFLRLGAGVSEQLFRAAYLIFPLIAAGSMYSLGRRFTSYPLLAALLLVFTAGFMVISHTLMGDLPGLALWLASVALFVRGADRDSWRILLASGVVIALAVMTSYQTLSLVPLLLFYVLVKKKFRLRVFLPLAIPMAVFGVYTLFNYLKYGGPPVFSYVVGISYGWQDLDMKVRALLVFIGGATIFPLAMIPLFMRKKVDLLFGFLFLPPLVTWAAVYYLGVGNLNVSQALVLAVMLSAGFLVLYKLFANTISGFLRRSRGGKDWTDWLFLLVWFCGVLTYIGVFLPFVTVRFLLPLFPPLVLLFTREVESLWPMRPHLRSAFVLVTLALTLAVGLATAVADYHLAGAQREAAERFGRRFAGSDNKVWVLGEFGFRYYMQKQGFEYLGVRSVAHSGDIVIGSYINAAEVVAPLPPGTYRVISVDEPQDSFPVRLMNPWAGAGFYAHLMGPLPEMISREKLDEYTVYKLYWQEDEGGTDGSN